MKYVYFKGTSRINRKGIREKASFGYSDTNYGSLVEFSAVWMRRCFHSKFVKAISNRHARRVAKQSLVNESLSLVSEY